MRKTNNFIFSGGLKPIRRLSLILTLGLTLLGCSSAPISNDPQPGSPLIDNFPTPAAALTPLPSRAPFQPGELVEYIAQTGDTLPALSLRFNTTEAEIRAANPQIPQDATTMPPGFPMQIPIYYQPLWGTTYQSLPDWHYVNGPAQVGFNTAEFINQHQGWLKTYLEPGFEGSRSAAAAIDLVAKNFSISPRLLIAMLEYQAQGLSNPAPPQTVYFLGYPSNSYKGLYLQLVWAANTLNNGYYGWRGANLREFETPDGRLQRPDPWQNAASVSLQYFYSRLYNSPLYDQIIGPGGLAQTYTSLFGNPWQNGEAHLPGSLRQPEFRLPFENGKSWNYTGGPHTGWGVGEPFAAIDFAPVGVSNCDSTSEWVTAMAAGLVVRTETGVVVLDLDGDGQEGTGWVIFYLHVATQDRARVGQSLPVGGRIGHPSCEGGSSTGTHVHIARKYNGEWILADGPLALNMEGWVAAKGPQAYRGILTRYSRTITASTSAEGKSVITAGE
ncbi:MAG: LysM peptidoglycan-binding domain-containing protein [Anaerolineales bacterium]|nr:LysM peptidoglycan-binding domain-containing protein [Anaerolineales bacterium]